MTTGNDKSVGFLELLTLLLIGLKLTGKTNMSWWIVLAPMWVPTLAALIFLAVIFYS